jgi:hypothetical protein
MDDIQDRYRTPQRAFRAPAPVARTTPAMFANQPVKPLIEVKKRKLPHIKPVFLIIPAVLVMAVLGAFLVPKLTKSSPIPADIAKQVSYRVIYPSKTHQIAPASFDYEPDQKTLSFIVNHNHKNVVFTEQPAPDTLAANGQVYYPALGLHPYAQFQTNLGPVALAKFWKSGSLDPVGQSGVLATNGVLLVAHTDKNMTNTEWKDLFNSLQLSP